MNAADMYKTLNEGFQHTCPSGITVTMRRLSLSGYLRNGTLPSQIQAAAETVQNSGLQTLIDDDKAGLQRFYEWVVCTCLLDPAVSVSGDEETIPLDYLPEQDKADIFRVAIAPSRAIVDALRPLSPATEGSGSSSSTPSPDVTEPGQAA